MKRSALAAVMAVSITASACSGGGTDRAASVQDGDTPVQDGGNAGRKEENSGIPAGSGVDGQMSQPGGGSTSAAQGGAGSASAAQDGAGSASGAQGGSGGISRAPIDKRKGDIAETDKAEAEIVLPQNENWYSNPVYSVEDGTVRQVLFRDEITGSGAVVRASKKEDGDPSVFFYVFDDSKKEKWSARAEDGTSIDITVEVTVENSDIHGVLATWEHGGVLYALWEDDAADAMDSVAKIAMEIAERSR